MIPPARDPRMDAGLAEPGHGGLHRVPRAMWVALTVLALGVLVAWPRAAAYPSVVSDNLAMKTQLRQVDDRMEEVDRILARLRLYDAQLRSLTEGQGDHGPLPPIEAMSNAGVLEYYQDVEAEAADHGPVLTSDDLLGEGDIPVELLRPADAWAEGIADRVDGFVDMFEMSEADLAALMADLETLRAIHQALPGVWPAEGVLTSGFGWRRDPMRRYTKFHSGIDIAAGTGTPLYAVADGVVVRSQYTSGYGNVIEIDHGFGIETKYAHCSRRKVRVGDRVEQGDYIGTMGSTGRSTGPHLHFELRIDGSAHDPLTYLPR